MPFWEQSKPLKHTIGSVFIGYCSVLLGLEQKYLLYATNSISVFLL